MDARKGHFMPPGLLVSQLATLERPNLATEKCLHLSITLTPEQICATVAVAMRRFA
jgi:gluconokinase